MIKKGLSSLLICFLYALSLLPFWLLYILADGIYVLLYYISGYRRKVVWQNLQNAFPKKTGKELHRIEKQYYKYLADLMVESIKMISIGEAEVKRRMHALNPELIDKYYAEGKSIIGVVGHYGNWELAAHRFSLIGGHKKIIVYKPLSNKTADSYYKKIRERFGALLVPMKGTLRTLAQLKNQPTFTVLVADQTPVKAETQYFTNFLNQATAVFLGPEKIAKSFNSVVVFCDVRRVKRGFYEYRFAPLCENAAQTTEHEITELHVKYLEKMIEQEPQYWLWSHRRWKFKPEDLQ